MSKRPANPSVVDGGLSDAKAIKLSRASTAVRGGLTEEDKRDEADVTTGEQFDAGVLNEEYVSKHTLESDEEEDEKYERLDINKVEGQEEATEEYDGNIKITPFNMKEEEEEGHFDAMGSYVFDKNKEDIHDAWLDNIDWSRVKKDAGMLCGLMCTPVPFAGKHWTGTTAAATASLGDEEPVTNDDDNLVTMPSSITPAHVVELYTQIHAVLASPHETVTQALKRLGGSVSAADARKARWAAKKASAASVAPSPVTRLTGLVDTLVANGEFEAYSYTKEKLAAEIEKRNNLSHFEASAAKAKSADELDIFADKIDKADDKMDASQEATTTKTSSATAATNDDSTNWEFKWENTADAPVQGPASSQQMHEWSETGHFKDGVWVRKVGDQNTQFYSSRRIDFDLYT